MWLFKLLLLAKRRWIQKLSFWRRRSLRLLLVCLFELPPPFGYSLIQEGELFSFVSVYINSSSGLRGGGRQAGGVWKFCLRIHSNSLPRSGTPSYPRGRVVFSLYSICYQSSASWIRGGGRQAGGVWWFCLCILSNSLPFGYILLLKP